jgi:hypothetical protein
LIRGFKEGDGMKIQMMEWDESPERDKGEPDYEPIKCDCGHDESDQLIAEVEGKTYCRNCYENGKSAFESKLRHE